MRVEKEVEKKNTRSMLSNANRHGRLAAKHRVYQVTELIFAAWVSCGWESIGGRGPRENVKWGLLGQHSRIHNNVNEREEGCCWLLLLLRKLLLSKNDEANHKIINVKVYIEEFKKKKKKKTNIIKKKKREII